jgi:hypothetical protein
MDRRAQSRFISSDLIWHIYVGGELSHEFGFGTHVWAGSDNKERGIGALVDISYPLRFPLCN